MSEPVVITSGELTATASPLGAELLSLTDAAGREYMTDADPRWWTGHAPILFPIVGALDGGHYTLDGRRYPLNKHGFARISPFAVTETDGDRARFVLTDSEATRAVYPFAFALELAFAIKGLTLTTAAIVTNRGKASMPFSFGFHPAFAWPLPGGGAQLAHDIVFQYDEPHDVARIDSAGLLARYERSPIIGDRLTLRPELFEDDALIWDTLASRRLSYRGLNGVSLDLAFPDCPMLGVWQKPGAHYICIEPWQGIADPDDFVGDFRDKPGVVELAPNTSRTFRLSITVTPAPENTP